MSVIDLAKFSEEDFDPKRWINAACTNRPTDDTLDKYLAELEIKLQLLAEDISVSLEDHSRQALQRIPRALGEVGRVKDDGLMLQVNTHAIVQKLVDVEATSARSVELLASVDAVKLRMESAANTMSEASGLAELMDSVEEVFAGSDLKLMANTLARMRRGLKVVGEVPEFKHGHERVAALEDRLEAMVSPALYDALYAHDSQQAQELCEILVVIGRYSALERQYTTSRLRPMMEFWEQYDTATGITASFVAWLPSFYDAVLLQFQQDARWCASVFPEHHVQLLVQLIVTLLQRTLDSYKKRLQDTLAEVQVSAASEEQDYQVAAAAASGGALAALLAAFNAATSFARGSKEVLLGLGAGGAEVGRVLAGAFQPF